MAEVMPVVQAEILKAQGDAIKAQSDANQKQDVTQMTEQYPCTADRAYGTAF